MTRLRHLPRLSRPFWIALFAVFLSSSLWMGALHHHEDFSRENPDCIFCHAAGGLAVVTPTFHAPAGIVLIARLEAAAPCDGLPSPVPVLALSPKTGPPSLPV